MSRHEMPDESRLRQFFAAVDKDRSNAINATELQSALSNGTFEPFNVQTIHLMISMFGGQHKGTINSDEFSRLWRYITDWLNCFQSFDSDNSGHIDAQELTKALTTFGYRFSAQFYDTLTARFDRRIHFDDFIRICIHLQSLTEQFKQQDTDLDGVITLTYEQFVSLVFSIVLTK